MKFGPVPLSEAEGATLAHSVQAGKAKLRKGTVLGSEELSILTRAGIPRVTVARLEPGDVTEDEAAARLATALGGDGVKVTEPFTGRSNLVASGPGVLRVDTAAVTALNAVDPGITLATLPDYTRVADGMMLATVKIIPYAVSGVALDRALAALSGPALSISDPVIAEAQLILTRTDAMPGKLIAKGEQVVRDRLAALGVRLTGTVVVDHDTDKVARELISATAPLVLILGASATSDVRDVCPAALVQAGGQIIRFGMPVDPGNLLFLGTRAVQTVIGLPGCARSPALNGADWVLERVVCGIPVGDTEIAAMGVGGLLKEIPLRPQPRAIRDLPPAAPRFEVVLLAAGASRRMGGRDKLLEPVEGVPLLRRMAGEAIASAAGAVHVVLPPDRPDRVAALSGTGTDPVIAADAAEGMAASLRAGLARVGDDAEGVIVMLADMPDVSTADLNALMEAYDPEKGREICRAVAQSGVPGHPVLFGRRFFENLSDLTGDTGAREVMAAGSDFMVDVPTGGEAAVTDLDTPEQWDAYRARTGSA